MGWASVDITNDGASYEDKIKSFEVSEGILYGLSAITRDTSVPPSAYYAQLGLMDSIESYANVVQILANGCFGSISSIGWTGRFPIPTDTLLFARLKIPANSIVRLSWLILKPSESLSSMQVLDA